MTDSAAPDQITTPLGEATGDLRDLLIALAEKYADRTDRPCCDADTTLADWQEVLPANEIEAVQAKVSGTDETGRALRCCNDHAVYVADCPTFGAGGTND